MRDITEELSNALIKVEQARDTFNHLEDEYEQKSSSQVDAYASWQSAAQQLPLLERQAKATLICTGRAFFRKTAAAQDDENAEKCLVQKAYVLANHISHANFCECQEKEKEEN